MFNMRKNFTILIFLNALVFFSSVVQPRLASNVQKVSTRFESLKSELQKFKSDKSAQKQRVKFQRLINKFGRFAKKNAGSKYETQALVHMADLYYNLAKKKQAKNDWLLCARAYEQLWKKYKKDPYAKKALLRARDIRKHKLGKNAVANKKVKPKKKIFSTRKRAKKVKQAHKNSVFNNTRLKRVVIDAGHGGLDNGNVGARGLKEKNVNLSIARKVAAQIRKQMPHVKVYMTRNRDKKMSLSARTNYANKVEADLFISIHTNLSKNKHKRGIETYYLDITHDRYALRLSARENATTEGQITDLEYILADMNVKSNTQESMRLGQAVQRSVLTKVQRVWCDTKDLGLKHAMLYVLLGAKMPAILFETSFISNAKEEKRLRTRQYQESVAAGLVHGIKRYAEEKQASYVP